MFKDVSHGFKGDRNDPKAIACDKECRGDSRALVEPRSGDRP
jgi:hypothetical protein